MSSANGQATADSKGSSRVGAAAARQVIADPRAYLLDLVEKTRVMAGGLTDAQVGLLTGEGGQFNAVGAAHLIARLVRAGTLGSNGKLEPLEVARLAGKLALEDNPAGRAGVLGLIDQLEKLIGEMTDAQCAMLDTGLPVSPLRLMHVVVVGLRVGQLGAGGRITELDVAKYIARVFLEST